MHLLLSALLLLACGDKDEEDDTSGTTTDGGGTTTTDGGTSTDGGATDACEHLDPATCATRAECRVIDARKLVPDGAGGLCLDWTADPVAVGCMAADMGCAEAEAVASSPDSPGTCDWWFSNLCLPPGWEVCDGRTADTCP